jgi:hypothetical protein
LERLSSRLHALRRQRHLQEIKHAVFLEQARQNISNQKDSELLARQAEFASRKPRAFAYLLGHADACAARDAHLESLGTQKAMAEKLEEESSRNPEESSAEPSNCLSEKRTAD